MKLDKVLISRDYEVQSLKIPELERGRFFKLGVYPGAIITLERKAPIFSDPLIFRLEGSQIIMTKFEASHIEVKALES